jgi:AIPR protein
MIERNNGITFKASSIKYEGEYVILENAGIINGCQTTLCIVKAQPSSDCYVPVKIVTTADEQNSSDIARTANTQNRIDKINLELSDFIRPQLIKSSLAEIGINLADDEASKTAPRVAASISKQRIFKSDLRYLFVGLFSYTPRNIFNSDYANIRFDEIRSTFLSTENKKDLNSLLAKLIVRTSQAFDKLKETYPSEVKDSSEKTPESKVGKVFNRFYVDQKGYKSYLTVLSIYCLLKIDDEKRIRELKIDTLVKSIENIVETQEQELEVALGKVFKSIAISVINHFSEKGKDMESKDLENEVSQYLSQYISRTQLSAYYMMYAMVGA